MSEAVPLDQGPFSQQLYIKDYCLCDKGLWGILATYPKPLVLSYEHKSIITNIAVILQRKPDDVVLTPNGEKLQTMKQMTKLGKVPEPIPWNEVIVDSDPQFTSLKASACRCD